MKRPRTKRMDGRRSSDRDRDDSVQTSSHNILLTEARETFASLPSYSEDERDALFGLMLLKYGPMKPVSIQQHQAFNGDIDQILEGGSPIDSDQLLQHESYRDNMQISSRAGEDNFNGSSKSGTRVLSPALLGKDNHGGDRSDLMQVGDEDSLLATGFQHEENTPTIEEIEDEFATKSCGGVRVIVGAGDDKNSKDNHGNIVHVSGDGSLRAVVYPKSQESIPIEDASGQVPSNLESPFMKLQSHEHLPAFDVDTFAPQWLSNLVRLGPKFFDKVCEFHTPEHIKQKFIEDKHGEIEDEHRNLEQEKKRKKPADSKFVLRFFCKSCLEGPLCETGQKKNHEGHEVLQIRRTSKRNSVLFKDLEVADGDVNYNHIVPFIINKKAVLFIEGKVQPIKPKGAIDKIKLCKTCGRTLGVGQDNISHSLPKEYVGVFCSIGCKMTYLTTRSGQGPDEHDPKMACLSNISFTWINKVIEYQNFGVGDEETKPRAKAEEKATRKRSRISHPYL